MTQDADCAPQDRGHVSPVKPFTAEQLINQLPRTTRKERSYAHWVRVQLDANDRWWQPLSTAIVGTVSTAMAAFLHLGFRKVVFEDMHKLTDIIEDPMRTRPVITVANHISTMDDPLIWGAMPKHMRWSPEHMRWTLGAKELLYKNPVLNMFFAYGQTIPTIRGAGIHQLAMEIALRRLRENRWVHVFPEGKVNQDDHLIRLKWGVGRLIMESDRVPIVVPMFHHGMKEVMPLRQKVPMPYPNPWKSVFYLKIGDAVDFTQQVSEWKAMREKLTDPVEIADLDEKVRVQITARVWAAMDELKTMAEAAIGDGRLDT